METTNWQDCNHVEVVGSPDDILTRDFNGNTNCLLAERSLSGDFNALARDMARFFVLDDVIIFTPNAMLTWHEPISALDKYAWSLSIRHEGEETDNLRATFATVKGDIEAFAADPDIRPTLRLVRSYKAYGEYMPHVDESISKWGKTISPYNNPTGVWYNDDDVASIDRQSQFVTLKDDAAPNRFKSGDLWRFKCLNAQEEVANPFAHNGERADDSPRLVLVAD